MSEITCQKQPVTLACQLSHDYTSRSLCLLNQSLNYLLFFGPEKSDADWARGCVRVTTSDDLGILIFVSGMRQQYNCGHLGYRGDTRLVMTGPIRLM